MQYNINIIQLKVTPYSIFIPNDYLQVIYLQLLFSADANKAWITRVSILIINTGRTNVHRKMSKVILKTLLLTIYQTKCK